MKRAILMMLGLLVAPAMVAAQVEIGVDAGVAIHSYDDVTVGSTTVSVDSETNIEIPAPALRIGFMAGDMMIVDSRLGFSSFSQGDYSMSNLFVAPGVDFLLGEMFYVRGEAGLNRASVDPGSGSVSTTQYLFGGGAGLRKPLGDGALLRAEAGVARWLENTDDNIPASWEIHFGIGVSAVVN